MGACAGHVDARSFSWSIRRALKGGFTRGRILSLIVADIAIHVEPSEGTFERIDHPVMVLVEFLKVIMEDFTRLRVWRSTCSAVYAGVVALWLLENSVIREVRLRLDDGRCKPLLRNLPMAMDLPGNGFGWYRLLAIHCGNSCRNLPIWRMGLNYRGLGILLRRDRSSQHRWLQLAETTQCR
jgi:hypothetical protein